MGWNNTSTFPLLIVPGTGPPNSGIFVYSPAKGPNNLVAAMVAASGNDPAGNIVLAGIGRYGFLGGTYFLTLLATNGLGLYTAGSQSAGWNLRASVTTNAAGVLQLVGQSITMQGASLTYGQETWLTPSGDATGATDLANINAALAATKRVCLLPGNYFANSVITIPAGKVLEGLNAFRTAAGPVITAVGLTFGSLIAFAAGTPAGSIQGITLSGQGLPAGTVDGIGCIGACKQGSIIDCVAHHFTGHGIDIAASGGNPDGWFVKQVSCHDNAGAGIWWDYAVDGQLSDFHCDHNANGLMVGTMNNWAAINGRCQQNTGVGYGSTGGFIKASATFTACGSENNGTNGWDFTGTNGQGAIILDGCWARDDGTSGVSGSGFAGFNLGGLGNDLVKILNGCNTYVTASTAGPDYGLHYSNDKGRMVATGCFLMGSVGGYLDGGGNTNAGIFGHTITATGQAGTLAGYAVLET